MESATAGVTKVPLLSGFIMNKGIESALREGNYISRKVVMKLG